MLRITLLQRPFSVPLLACDCMGCSTLSSSLQMGVTFGCGLSPMPFLFRLLPRSVCILLHLEVALFTVATIKEVDATKPGGPGNGVF